MNDHTDPAIAAVTKALDWNNHEYRVDAASGHTPYCRCGWKADRPYDVDAFDLHLATLAVEAAAPLIAAKALADVRQRVEFERDHARRAHKSAAAEVDYMAHDYCRWVGHAEALTNTLRDIDERADALEAGQP